MHLFIDQQMHLVNQSAKIKKKPECEICTKLFSTTSGFLNLGCLNCENKMSEFGDKSTRYIVKL